MIRLTGGKIVTDGKVLQGFDILTEDGKIAFETPGFSTFAGFTVDFDYEGTQFSINGKTSILLSIEKGATKSTEVYDDTVTIIASSKEELLEEIKKKGVEVANVTLHVGIGTFRPVKVENIEEHSMHSVGISANGSTNAVLNLGST